MTHSRFTAAALAVGCLLGSAATFAAERRIAAAPTRCRFAATCPLQSVSMFIGNCGR